MSKRSKETYQQPEDDDWMNNLIEDWDNIVDPPVQLYPIAPPPLPIAHSTGGKSRRKKYKRQKTTKKHFRRKKSKRRQIK